MRLTTLLALLVVLAVISLSCIKDQPSSRKELTLAVVSGVEGEALKQATLDYEAKTGVHINVAEFPYTNLFEKVLIDFNARTGAYDLVMLDDPWFPLFATKQFLTPLDPLLKQRGQAPDNDFVETSIALCHHPYQVGSQYALPYVGNSQLFFYRKDLFDKYNLKPPATWDDVLTAAKTIQEKESGSGMYGYVMRAAQGNAAVADFMPILWAFGGELLDPAAGKPTVNSPEAIAALEFMVELGKYSPPGYASFNADEVGAHLLQGTAAMSINWPAWISKFDDPTKSKVIGKIGFTTLPSGRRPGKAEIGNWLIAIPQESRNQEAAMDFLLWATSAEQMKLSALRGNPPTRKSLFRDPELVAKFPAYPEQLRSLETSRPRPRTPQWNEIENVFGIFISKANSGALSPAEAMNQANAEIEKIVQRGQ
jgi:multiple sugar transport system substrate-binding protein